MLPRHRLLGKEGSQHGAMLLQDVGGIAGLVEHSPYDGAQAKLDGARAELLPSIRKIPIPTYGPVRPARCTVELMYVSGRWFCFTFPHFWPP
jgi:hypothetical protein